MSTFSMNTDDGDVIQIYTDDEIFYKNESDVKIIFILDDKINEISSFLTPSEARMLGERLIEVANEYS